MVAYFGVTDPGMNSAAANGMPAAYARDDDLEYAFSGAERSGSAGHHDPVPTQI
jgi:hypothetical protein